MLHVFSLTCLNFSHFQCTLHLMQYIYQDFFPHSSKQFLNLSILMLLVLLLFFVSPLPHRQNVSLEDFFHPGRQKSSSGQDRVSREGGAQGSSCFGKKLLNTQCSVGRCTGKSPIMKWANTLKESSKKPNTASHKNTSWCTDTDGFLEPSPSGGSL